MTQMLQNAIREVAGLSDEEQEVLAFQIIADVRALGGNTSAPEWHKRLLLERAELLRQSPDRLIPLEAVRDGFERRKEHRAEG